MKQFPESACFPSAACDVETMGAPPWDEGLGMSMIERGVVR